MCAKGSKQGGYLVKACYKLSQRGDISEGEKLKNVAEGILGAYFKCEIGFLYNYHKQI